jgi:hypothetical protein
MLFGRLEDEKEIMNSLYPAFQEYLGAYTDMMKKVHSQKLVSEKGREWVKEMQKEYDVYNLIRDPAGKMFEAYFGKEWTHDFMNNFLFELA